MEIAKPDTTVLRPHVLLLTGIPGVGKTTVIRRLTKHLAGRRLGGFYTEEIRDQEERKGFRLITFDGHERVIAHVNLAKDRKA